MLVIGSRIKNRIENMIPDINVIKRNKRSTVITLP